MRTSAVERHELRLKPSGRFRLGLVQIRVVIFFEDIPAYAKSYRAADDDVREKMVSTREARHADRGSGGKGAVLYPRIVSVFIGDDRCDRPDR